MSSCGSLPVTPALNDQRGADHQRSVNETELTQTIDYASARNPPQQAHTVSNSLMRQDGRRCSVKEVTGCVDAQNRTKEGGFAGCGAMAWVSHALSQSWGGFLGRCPPSGPRTQVKAAAKTEASSLQKFYNCEQKQLEDTKWRL